MATTRDRQTAVDYYDNDDVNDWIRTYIILLFTFSPYIVISDTIIGYM